MADPVRRRLTTFVAALTTAAALTVATASPAQAAESYVVSYPTPARYHVDSSPVLTVRVADFDLSLDPRDNVRTVQVRSVHPDGETLTDQLTLTPLTPTGSVPFATHRRGSLAYSVTIYDADGDLLDQRAFVAEVVGRPTGLRATWPAVRRVRERASYVVRGQVGGGQRRLLVQRRASDTWVTLGSGRSQGSGSYAVRVDTRWVTQHRRLRVLAQPSRTHDARAVAKATALAVTRSYRPRPGRAWRPIRTSSFVGQRWTACGATPAVITYRVNPARAPRGYLAEVRKAFAQVTAATGFGFRYAGTTTLVPLARGSREITRKADITIAYANQRLVPALQGGVVGVASTRAQDTFTDWWRVIAGAVVVDTEARLAPGFAGGRATRGSALIHELGHVMGLDHVSDRRQTMFPAITTVAARYAGGDLRGLARVGLGRGCFPGETNPYARTTSGRTRVTVHTVGVAHPDAHRWAD